MAPDHGHEKRAQDAHFLEEICRLSVSEVAGYVLPQPSHKAWQASHEPLINYSCSNDALPVPITD